MFNLKKVDFIWINRDQKSFEWFINLLSQLENTSRKDDKTTKEISILKSKAEEEEEKVKKKEEVVEQIIETILRVQLHNLTSTVSCLSTMQLNSNPCRETFTWPSSHDSNLENTSKGIFNIFDLLRLPSVLWRASERLRRQSTRRSGLAGSLRGRSTSG